MSWPRSDAVIIDFLKCMYKVFPEDSIVGNKIVSLMDLAHSQIYQDVVALAYSDIKRNGYFVEFGACDGIDMSNTFMLEQQFGWTGILAEPARVFHKALSENRPNSKIDHNCIWSETDKTLPFFETEWHGGLSTVESYKDFDFATLPQHKGLREKGKIYDVNTVSLEDLLKKHDAPYEIDFLSIDTEGTEFEILSKFDFTKYKIKLIMCEHNYTASKDSIYNLLTTKGYKRILENISYHDDWYILIS